MLLLHGVVRRSQNRGEAWVRLAKGRAHDTTSTPKASTNKKREYSNSNSNHGRQEGDTTAAKQRMGPSFLPSFLALEAWSMESRKGKKASDDRLTPDSSARKASFSSVVSASGLASKLDSHASRSEAVMSPSMYLQRRFQGGVGGGCSTLVRGERGCGAAIPTQFSYVSRPNYAFLPIAITAAPQPNKIVRQNSLIATGLRSLNGCGPSKQANNSQPHKGHLGAMEA